MTRRFTNGISHVLGSYRDIPAPDVNTNAQTMAWMMDAYSATHGYTPAIVTGKPVDLGGAPGPRGGDRAGRASTCSRPAAEHWSSTSSGMHGRVQGFGNVGSWAARELPSRGAKVVAVSDVYGGVLPRDGLDVSALVGAARRRAAR